MLSKLRAENALLQAKNASISEEILTLNKQFIKTYEDANGVVAFAYVHFHPHSLSVLNVCSCFYLSLCTQLLWLGVFDIIQWLVYMI